MFERLCVRRLRRGDDPASLRHGGYYTLLHNVDSILSRSYPSKKIENTKKTKEVTPVVDAIWIPTQRCGTAG